MSLLKAVGVALVLSSSTGAAPALADTVTSSNWAGYAVHRSGVAFSRVIGEWHVPSATCTSGEASYSASWIGLGGYALGSSALEQIGTESDCTTSGQLRTSVWYELVPAASRTISMMVDPGDVMAASVSVTGHRVTLALYDRTRKRSFRRTMTVASIDVSSAEWIIEAPSECVSASSCQTLPLANFGSAGFSLAAARTRHGRRGTISSRVWKATRIRLASAGTRFVSNSGARRALVEATPSALSANGTAFKIAASFRNSVS